MMASLLSWLQHNLPSWLQAFAAVVALFIAVWSTLRADLAERRRDRLQARCIAAAVAPDLAALMDAAAGSQNILNDLVSLSETR